jgi:hypothetical protein
MKEGIAKSMKSCGIKVCDHEKHCSSGRLLCQVKSVKVWCACNIKGLRVKLKVSLELSRHD